VTLGASFHCSSFSATRRPLVIRCEGGVQKWKTEYGFVGGKNGFNCVSCGTHPVKRAGLSFAKNENPAPSFPLREGSTWEKTAGASEVPFLNYEEFIGAKKAPWRHTKAARGLRAERPLAHRMCE